MIKNAIFYSVFSLLIFGLFGCDVSEDFEAKTGEIQKNSILLMNKVNVKEYSEVLTTDGSLDRIVNINTADSPNINEVNIIDGSYAIQSYISPLTIKSPSVTSAEDELIYMWKYIDYILESSYKVGGFLYNNFNSDFEGDALKGSVSKETGTIFAYYKDENLRTPRGAAYALWANADSSDNGGFAYFYKQGEIFNQFYTTWEGGNLINNGVDGINKIEFALSSFDENYTNLSDYFILIDRTKNNYIEFVFSNSDLSLNPQPMFNIRVKEFDKEDTNIRRQIVGVGISDRNSLYGALIPEPNAAKGEASIEGFLSYYLIIDYDINQKTYTLAARKSVNGRDIHNNWIQPMSIQIKKYSQDFSTTSAVSEEAKASYTTDLEGFAASYPSISTFDIYVDSARDKLREGETKYRN